MIVLVTALILATSDSTSPCCRQTARLQSDSDPSHAVGHVISPMVATATFYGAAMYLGAERKHARIISVGLSAVMIVAKELYDQHSAAHNFSTSDVAFGVAGTAAGLLIAEKIEWPESHKTRLRR